MLTSPCLTQLPAILHGFGARRDDMAVRFPALWPVRPVQHERRDGKEVAALHVGWRGAQAGIVARFAELVRDRGGDPGDWIAAIGPAAHPCCYEVSAELVEDFRARVTLAPEVVAPSPRRIDLPAIVRWQVEQAGIADVSVSPACTMCAADAGGRHVFHSYRRDRETRTPVVDVQWSVIAIAASARLSARPR